MKIMITIILCLSYLGTAFAADDWTYELSPDAKKIYENKSIQIPCDRIPALLSRNSNDDIYISIRDAGLFKLKSCNPIIQKYLSSLLQIPGGKDVVAFYFFRLGDKKQLDVLAANFDRHARTLGDISTVELFGYLDDWDISGVRLVRHAAYSDGAAAELLCSAIVWRRYLYGENNFKVNWYSMGEKEKIKKSVLDHFYERCKPE